MYGLAPTLCGGGRSLPLTELSKTEVDLGLGTGLEDDKSLLCGHPNLTDSWAAGCHSASLSFGLGGLTAAAGRKAADNDNNVTSRGLQQIVTMARLETSRGQELVRERA